MDNDETPPDAPPDDDDGHTEDETPPPVIPPGEVRRCPNMGCGTILMPDGVCPRCSPR